MTNLNPGWVETVHAGLEADWQATEALNARLGFDMDYYIDNYDRSLSGHSKIVSLRLSGKFGKGK